MKWFKLALMLVLMAVLLPNLSPALANEQATDPCEKALPPRLIVGLPGEILHTDGSPLNVRNDANLDAKILARVAEGVKLTVMAGPACGDGLYWWQIKVGALTGWAAESDSKGYFVGRVHQPLKDSGRFEAVITYQGEFYHTTFKYSRIARNIRHFVLIIPEKVAAEANADATSIFSSIQITGRTVSLNGDKADYHWAEPYLYDAPGGYFEGELALGTYRVAAAFVAGPVSREDVGAGTDAVLWAGITGGGASTEFQSVKIKAGKALSLQIQMTDANGWACPWLYVYHDGALQRRTEILRNVRGQDYERTETTPLGPLTVIDGHIMIKVAEEKDEVTYLDGLHLLIDSQPVYAEPESGVASLLRSADGRYLVLHKGESAVLRFPVPASYAGDHPVEVVAKGYYVPTP